MSVADLIAYYNERCFTALLRKAEDIIQGGLCIEKTVHTLNIALVSKLKLVFQIVESVVNRGRGKHQDFGLHARTDDLIHQTQITILTGIFTILISTYLTTIPKVMALINNHKVIVAPVYAFQIEVIAPSIVT